MGDGSRAKGLCPACRATPTECCSPRPFNGPSNGVWMGCGLQDRRSAVLCTAAPGPWPWGAGPGRSPRGAPAPRRPSRCSARRTRPAAAAGGCLRGREAELDGPGGRALRQDTGACLARLPDTTSNQTPCRHHSVQPPPSLPGPHGPGLLPEGHSPQDLSVTDPSSQRSFPTRSLCSHRCPPPLSCVTACHVALYP